MAAPHVKLANSLEILKAIQDRSGAIIELAAHPELTRVHRERLQASGHLTPVIGGWYIANHPGEEAGSSTLWYANLDAFIAAYATSKFGSSWQMSPEVSLLRHSGETGVIRQLLLHAPQASNHNLPLPHGCALFMNRITESALDGNPSIGTGGLRLQSVERALIAVGPAFFQRHPLAAQIALRAADATALARLLLAGDHTTIAGRLIGALRAVGRGDEADDLGSAMRAAGHKLNEANPFDEPPPAVEWHAAEPPHVQRVRAMWAQMRPLVMAAFADLARQPPASDIPQLLKEIEDRYQADAYHSLSIEGYRVTEALIEKVRSGNWSPAGDGSDREKVNALNARGYFELHRHLVQLTQDTLGRQLEPGQVFKKDLPSWYRIMFGPSVQAGIVPPEALAGYRNHPIYIRNARHVPPAPEWARLCMPVFLELMAQEPEAAVRAVLGHFIFVYIHPYMDGNGRIGRFIMNFMLCTGGYPWTIVPVQSRETYLKALDLASGDGDIRSFSEFIAGLAGQQRKKPVGLP